VNSTELKRAKRAVRAEVLARRDALDPVERAALGERIVERLLDLPELRAARAVMAFWSFGSEVPMDPLIARLVEAGVTVALPRIADGHLEPRTWRPGEPVTETHFGAREPEGGRVLDPSEIDVVATPGVAFDRTGARVGYGGGFYDRLLAGFLRRPPTIAAAFSLQVQDTLPSEPSDQRVDAVFTEEVEYFAMPLR